MEPHARSDRHDSQSVCCEEISAPHPRPGGACARVVSWTRGIPRRAALARPAAPGFSFCGGPARFPRVLSEAAPTPPLGLASETQPRGCPAPSPSRERVGVRGKTASLLGDRGGPRGNGCPPLQPRLPSSLRCLSPPGGRSGRAPRSHREHAPHHQPHRKHCQQHAREPREGVEGGPSGPRARLRRPRQPERGEEQRARSRREPSAPRRRARPRRWRRPARPGSRAAGRRAARGRRGVRRRLRPQRPPRGRVRAAAGAPRPRASRGPRRHRSWRRRRPAGRAAARAAPPRAAAARRRSRPPPPAVCRVCLGGRKRLR